MKTRNILITGGTGSIGETLIKLFSEKAEYKVVFTFKSNKELANEIEKKYKAKGKIILNYEKEEYEYDIIVNNAGINITREISHKVEIKGWDETLLVNLTIPFLICRGALPYMIKQKWGRIINISSIYGIRSEEDCLPYNVSKHGLKALTTTIAKEYGKFGITCNEVCPGPVNSKLLERVSQKYSTNSREKKEFYNQIIEGIPIKRLAEPEDIANIVFFLASDNSSYINGVSIPVDGGATC